MERLLRIPGFQGNQGDIAQIFTLHPDDLQLGRFGNAFLGRVRKNGPFYSIQTDSPKNAMEEVSLATAEVKEKITHLLGKQSSHLFVCFCRVLYARKEDRHPLFVVVTRRPVDR